MVTSGTAALRSTSTVRPLPRRARCRPSPAAVPWPPPSRDRGCKSTSLPQPPSATVAPAFAAVRAGACVRCRHAVIMPAPGGRLEQDVSAELGGEETGHRVVAAELEHQGKDVDLEVEVVRQRVRGTEEHAHGGQRVQLLHAGGYIL